MSPPPPWLEGLLARVLPPEARETVLGDLREDYDRVQERRSRAAAALWLLGAGTSIAGRYFVAGLLSGGGRRGDLRLAGRRLRRAPAFTALAVSSLAVGLGANAVTLSVADGVLLAPLPFPEAERLGLLTYGFSGSESDNFGIAWRDLEALREATGTFERVAAVMDWVHVDLTGEGPARRLAASFVGPGYLELLGAEPLLGRRFTDGEAGPGGGDPVAMVSREFWTQALGGDPGVVGRTLDVNGRAVSVVGVLPGRGHDLRQRFGGTADVFLPLFSAGPLLGEDLVEDRGEGPLNALVRLRPGATAAEAQGELDRLSRELADRFPATNEGWTLHFDSLREVFYRDLRSSVAVLLGGAVLVLLLVGFNLGGLVLVRGLGGRHDAAMRRVLGAEPTRILRLSLAEGGLLVVGGTLLALGLAVLGIDLLRASPLLALPTFAPARLTPAALAVTLAMAVLLAAGLGLAGWLPLARSPVEGVVRHGGRTTASRGARRTRGLLVVGEVALAFALLVTAGLLLRSYRAVRDVDMGFDHERLMTLRIELRGERYEGRDARRAAARDLVDRARALPGAEEAFIWSPNGVGEGSWVDLVTRENRWDRYPAERLEVSRHHVLPGGLGRAGIRITRGRDVEPGDDGESPAVALVSESLAERLWPGEDPLGKAVESRPGGDLLVRRVVGVVEDARHRGSVAERFGPQLDVYYAFEQWPQRHLTVAVRLAPGASGSDVASRLRAAVAEMDPDLPLYDLATMAERLREEEARTRLTTSMATAYALLAAVLASLGIYGVLAQLVRDRRREIGIRLALGARESEVMARITARGMAAVLAGGAGGFLLVLAAGDRIGDVLHGVSVGDPVVLASTAALLGLVGLAASAVPAIRASKVDPVEALRD